MKKLIAILLLFIAGFSYGQLYVPAGNTLFTTNNGEIMSKENVVNNGIIYSVEMNSASAQSISGTGSMRYLKANNSSDISLLSSHSITNNGITLTGGKIILGSYNLTAVSVTNDGATRYIKTSGSGVLSMNATTGAYTKFPIGNTTYNYVRIYNNNAVADTFSVRVQDTLYSNAGNSTGSVNNSVNRTWTLSKIASNSGIGVNIEFNWNSGDVNGTLTNAVLYEYNGTKWVKANGTQSVSGNQITVTGYTGTLSSKQFMVSSSLGATVSVAASACQNTSGINVTFTGSGGTAPYTFTYTLNGGSNQTVTTTSGSSVTVSVITSSAGNQVFALVDVSDANLQNAVSGSATINIKATSTSTQSATACVSYAWNGTTYTTSGAKTWTGTNAAGCDSVATLNLTINSATSSSVSETACGSYTWHGNTYTTSGAYTWTGTNANSCDSVVTLNLTINNATSSSVSETACGTYTWHGNTYTTSGAYTWTGTNANSCDSVVTLNLTINSATSSSVSETACGSYAWHGTTYTTSGAKTWTGTNAAGCDSVATLNLTINSATSSSVSETACGSFTWNGNTYTTSGAYTWTGTNANSCDSVVTLNLTINSATSSSVSETACGSYAWHGNTYTTSGAYTWTGINANSCDSLVTLNLTINNATSSSVSETACGTFTWHGNTYTTSGAYTWTGTNANSCDSVVTLNLTINSATSSSVSETACGSYAWHGNTYTTSGAYTWTGINANSCDSLVTLNLTINNATSSSVSETACGTFTWHGNTYTTSGAYTWTGTNANSCDSVVTLNLTINNATSSSVSETACGSYAWHGNTYTTSGAYIWTGTNANSCDSVVTLNLTITASTSNTTPASACDSYTWSVNGQIYTSSGSYTSVSGCATEILNLTINQPNRSTTAITRCGSYNWNGQTYSTSGTYTWTGTNAGGCDSVANLNLTINAATSSSASATACGSYTWKGQTYTNSGVYTWTGTNAAGCDSIVTLNLTINIGTFNAETRIETSGYTWHGTLYAVSGTYTYSYNNSNGCASVDTLYLVVNTTSSVNVKNVCTYIGTNETLIYTANVAGASSYAWTLPANTQLILGQGTRSIVIKFLNGFATQANKQIRVTPAGGSLQIIYTNAQAPVTPATIVASSTNICQSLGTNVPITFTVPRVFDPISNGRTTTSYLWTAQNGTTTISHPNGMGENDTTVSITFASNFTSSNVSVQTLNACGVSGSRTYLISLAIPSQPGLISGPVNACEYIGTTGQLATYAVPADANVNSYAWTLPQGALNVSGLGTRIISFRYPTSFTGGTIAVTATNGCGTSASRSLTISRLAPVTPGNIDIINMQTCPNRLFTYSIATLPANATSVIWAIPNGATLVSGQGTTSITVSYPSGVVDGYVTVKSVSNCAFSSAKKSQVRMAPCSVNPSPQFTKGIMTTKPSAMEVKLFPNPTTSSFNLQVSNTGSKEIKISIMDLQGRVIKSFVTPTFQTNNIGNELNAGVYMVEVGNGEENKVVRVVKY